MNRRSLSLRWRRLIVLIRTEGAGVRRESAAIAAGVFIGCLPVYGFHLLICTALGSVLRLNRLKMYVAANISNPFVAPWLLFFEVQTGAWITRGSFHPLTLAAVETTSMVTVGTDLVLGAVAIGAVLGALAGGMTYMLLRGTSEQDTFTSLIRLASDRYIAAGILAWEFARGKLRSDPVYKAVVCGGLLTRSSPPRAAAPLRPGGTLLDIGCGMGLTLALLAEARRAGNAGTWPETWPEAPSFERIVGIEVRSRVAAIAAAALAGEAEVITAAAGDALPAKAHTVLLFDVLHLMSPNEQEALIEAIASILDPEGVVLVREADAAAQWRFTAVRWGNRLKALAFGRWRQQFHFRTASDWQDCLARHGLRGEICEMSKGTPFANVLLLVTPCR